MPTYTLSTTPNQVLNRSSPSGWPPQQMTTLVQSPYAGSQGANSGAYTTTANGHVAQTVLPILDLVRVSITLAGPATIGSGSLYLSFHT